MAMVELLLTKPCELKSREAEALPAPGADEVKLRTIYGGICGSDLRVYKGSINYAAYPIRPGHEVLGTVAAAGKNAPFAPGTRAVVLPNTFCGECEFCRKGRTNICKDKKPLGLSADGVFAGEILIEAKYVVPVPEDMPDEQAILIEPFAVTVHALKKAPIGRGVTVAVVGCGTEGLLAAALACRLGGRVTALDVNPKKLAIARQLGDIRAMHPGDLKDELFEVVVEAAGVKVSIEQAMEIVKPGGDLIAIGITGEQVNFPAIRIVRNEITIHGTMIYTPDDFRTAIGYLQDPAFDVGPVLSKILPVGQYQQAFDDALSGNFAKIVLDFGGV